MRKKRFSALARKDIKWIFGILAFLTILPILLVIGLFQVTQEKPAKALMSGAVSEIVVATIRASLSRDNTAGDASEPDIGDPFGGGPFGDSPFELDDPEATQEIKATLGSELRKVIESGGDPLGEGFPIPINIDPDTLTGVPDDEVINVVARAIADSLYEGAEVTVDAAGLDVPLASTVMRGAGRILSEQTNAFVYGIEVVLIIPALIFLAITSWASSGSGRAFNPGLILTIASFPVVIVYASIAGILVGVAQTTDSDLIVGLRLAANGASLQAIIVMVTGIVLMSIGFIWAIVRKGRGSKKDPIPVVIETVTAPPQPADLVAPPDPSSTNGDDRTV